ncbi:hypothetical protein [Bacillus phage SRT01hs]|uniref:Uncharacterized protein n=1 Tax=Bacillus phage SRT01hs TaxID=2847044 RepID=A0A6B9SYB5_9CAUD|nr:hypothetical protein H3022_gp27 [Bacillus phage SRT01hs]QHJ75879.1 hypothetical protein [Bacillus phage SRT01hs]
MFAYDEFGDLYKKENVEGIEKTRYRIRINNSIMFIGSIDYDFTNNKLKNVILNPKGTFNFENEEELQTNVNALRKAGLQISVEKMIKRFDISIDNSF